MCRVGWELTVSRSKGTSYWKHTASGQGLWPTSGKNKVQVLESEMLAMEIAHQQKRLLAKQAQNVSYQVPDTLWSGHDIASKTIPSRLPIPKDCTTTQTSLPRPTMPSSSKIVLPNISQEGGHKRKAEAPAQCDMGNSMTEVHASKTNITQRWVRASQAPKPQEDSNAQRVRAGLSSEQDMLVAQDGVETSKAQVPVECSAAAVGKMTTMPNICDVAIGLVGDGNGDICDVTPLLERGLDDEGQDGRGYQNIGADIDDKTVAEQSESESESESESDEDVKEELVSPPYFWQKPEKASCGLGKGKFSSFKGANGNSLGKSTHTNEDVASASLVESSAPKDVKPAKPSRREKQLASLARDLATSKCFVNQPNYVKS